MNSKRWYSLIGLLVALGMLVACGPQAAQPTPTTGPAPGGEATATAPAGGAEATPTTPAAEATPGAPGEAQGGIPGVLRVNWGSEPATIDPQKMSFVGEIAVGELVFEGLMELNEKLEPVPAAAEKCEVSADGLTYTCTVRDGLKYSDGTPLTAKNFEYAWQRLFDPTLAGREYAFVAYDIKGAQELSELEDTSDQAKLQEARNNLGVKALDDKTIQFTLKQKAGYFPYVLALWVGWPSRQDLVEAGGEDWTTKENGKYYVGNGPFIMTEYSEQGMKFKSNPNYRKGEPKIKEIRAVFISDSAVSFQAYRRGELDVVGVAAEDYQTVQNDPELKAQFVQWPGSCSFYIGFNTQKAPFDNPKVRQAFAQAFDRQDYVTNVLKGLGQPATSFIPPGRPGHEPDLKGWEFNAEKAKQTLAEAGFPNGQGLPEIKLTYSSTPRNKTRMEWVQNQLQKNLGITLQLDPVEPKTYTELTKDPATTPQVFFLGWCQDYPDPQNWLTLVFHSESTITDIGWKNEEFDRLTREADQLPVEQQQQRLQMYREAQEILLTEAPIVPLYWDVNTALIKPYIKGMKEHVNPQDHLIPGFMNIVNIEVAP
jgi:oligopeptide transport system substrate-binding protein